MSIPLTRHKCQTSRLTWNLCKLWSLQSAILCIIPSLVWVQILQPVLDRFSQSFWVRVRNSLLACVLPSCRLTWESSKACSQDSRAPCP